MAATLGASLVGMSTVLEAIAARHLGAEVLALSLVSNFAAGVGEGALSHREVLEAGQQAAASLGALLSGRPYAFCDRRRTARRGPGGPPRPRSR